MSALKNLGAAARREALSRKYAATYERGRAATPWLEPFTTVESLLHMLEDTRAETYPLRDGLARALMALHRTATSGLWSSLLLAAYQPLVRRLRGRINPGVLSNDDVDSIVLSAFMEAITKLPLDVPQEYTAKRLKGRTERYVFDKLRKERGQPVSTPGLDELMPEDSAFVEPDERAGDSWIVARRDLFHLAGDRIAHETMNLVIDTYEEPEALRQHIERMQIADAAERERAYQRLKKQRTRALRRLRLRAEEDSHLSERSTEDSGSRARMLDIRGQI